MVLLKYMQKPFITILNVFMFCKVASKFSSMKNVCIFTGIYNFTKLWTNDKFKAFICLFYFIVESDSKVTECIMKAWIW